MLRISKVDPDAHEQQLLEFFTEHKFQGVANARRVFTQGPSDLWLAEDHNQLVGC